jgi:hypothetical protein
MPSGHIKIEKYGICILCGNEFLLKQFHQKFCSSKCGIKHWKIKHIGKVKKWDLNWQRKDYKKNPEKWNFKVKNRIHRKRANGGNFTLQEWEQMKEKNGYRCVLCGLVLPLTQDHKIPVSKGGKHCKENIQPLCRSCNSKKKDKIEVFV